MSPARSRHRLPLLIVMAGLAACAQAPAPAPDRAERFRAELEALREEIGFPGATAAFATPDGSVISIAAGLADVETGRRMHPDDRMLAASIGKTFVAATVLSLAMEGKLRLDAPIADWLADRDWFTRLANHDSITIRHLLTHTAGLPDHVHLAEFGAAFSGPWLRAADAPDPETLVAFVLDRPALFPPGQSWSYTDTGYILLGMLVEEITGTTYYRQVSDRFLEPLGLALTIPSDRRALPGLVTGYTAPDNGFGLPAKTSIEPGVLAWHPGIEWTGGGLASNPRDLVAWAKALYEGRAMQGDYLRELLRSVPTGDAAGSRYGAGVAIREAGPGGISYGHAGWIPGYVSSLRYYPENRIAVAVQINTDQGFADSPDNPMQRIEQRLAAVATGRPVED